MDIVVTAADGTIIGSVFDLDDNSDLAIVWRRPDGSPGEIDLPADRPFAATAVKSLAISDANFGDGVAGAAYSPVPLTATGGAAPYKWSASGLPPGLTIVEGVVGGKPTTPGDYDITVTVVDGRGVSKSNHFTVKIVAPAPTPGQAPPPNAAPSGWRELFTLDFGSGRPLPRRVNARDGHYQNGTESISLARNVYEDSTLGALRLQAKIEPTSASGRKFPYSSAYMSIGSSAADRFPLFGRTQVCFRAPGGWALWSDPVWMNYLGAAAKLELDGCERFPDQADGVCTRFQVHSPDHYGKNLVRGPGDGTSGVRSAIAYRKTTPRPVKAATSRASIADYAFSDGSENGATPGHSGWHLCEIERYRIPVGASGWKLGVRYYLDGVLCVTWEETLPPGRTTPPWYVSGDDAHAFDLRADLWVGGESRARTVVDGKPLLDYDGKQKDGSSPSYMCPVGKELPMTLWKQDPKAVYSLDIAWVRELTK